MKKKEIYIYWSCWRKTRYTYKEDAENEPNKGSYKCRYCKGYHRFTIKEKK